MMPHDPWQGRIDNGPNWSNAKQRSGNWLVTCFDPVELGVLIRTVLHVLTDNAKVYRIGQDWRAVCVALRLRRRFTKPGCRWTNGKAERLSRTLQSEFPYAQPWLANTDRLAALDSWVEHDNIRRARSAIGGPPSITRLAA